MRQAAAAFGLALALVACTGHTRTGTVGDDVPGSDVARTIDIKIVPTLQTLPGVAVGHAACPDRLDISAGKTQYCTLPVGEALVRIAVAKRRANEPYFVKQADTLLDMRDIERRERALLAEDYDLRAGVRCGPPRIRIAVAGATITCALTGRALPVHRVAVDVVDAEGHILMLKPNGLLSAPIAPLMPYLKTHQAGSSVVMPGDILARSIPKVIHQGGIPTDDHLPLGAATCPATVDLTGTRRGLCRQRVAGHEVRVAVWIDRTGLRFEPLDYAISAKSVADAAVDVYRKQLAATGTPAMIAVDCGPERIVVADRSHGIPCTVTFGAASRAMTAHLLADGSLRFDLSPRPAKPAQ